MPTRQRQSAALRRLTRLWQARDAPQPAGQPGSLLAKCTELALGWTGFCHQPLPPCEPMTSLCGLPARMVLSSSQQRPQQHSCRGPHDQAGVGFPDRVGPEPLLQPGCLVNLAALIILDQVLAHRLRHGNGEHDRRPACLRASGNRVPVVLRQQKTSLSLTKPPNSSRSATYDAVDGGNAGVLRCLRVRRILAGQATKGRVPYSRKEGQRNAENGVRC